MPYLYRLSKPEADAIHLTMGKFLKRFYPDDQSNALFTDVSMHGPSPDKDFSKTRTFHVVFAFRTVNVSHPALEEMIRNHPILNVEVNGITYEVPFELQYNQSYLTLA